jgi:MFS family permease
VTSAATVRHPFSISSEGAFAALRFRAYRTYLAGQSLANIGAWMQSVAQDWLVLRLTNSATAVGITMALQFLPVLLLGVHGGLLADRYPRRRLLLATQTVNALLTAALAALTITGAIRAEHVYLFALLCGLVFVVDAPARQVFVTEVVPAAYLRSAISLNGAVFQTTRLVGPAVAGLLIGTVGTGWAFAANALCYLGPTVGLLRLRASDLIPASPADPEPRPLRTALRHVRERPQVFWTIFLVGVVGMFGLNFPIVLTAMASRTFAAGAGMYGLFNVVLAAGSAAGALLAGVRPATRLRLIVLTGGLFGVFQALDAAAPDLLAFLVLLICMGAANLAFQAMANTSVQLRVDAQVRGRVMGLYLLAFMGGTPIGAPIIGGLTNHYGARAGMLACGLIPVAACIAIALIKAGQLRSAQPAIR